MFLTATEFWSSFGSEKERFYEDFIAFKHGKVGFSIKRPYPQTISFKPALKKDGTPDTVAMIRVLYNPKNLSESDLDQTRVPIRMDIGIHSKYQYSHFGFNFEDDDCPTEESLESSQASPNPVGLSYADQFFFNHETCDFVDKRGIHHSGLEILQSVFDEHCDTKRKSRRRMWRSVAWVGFICEQLVSVLEYLLRLSFRKRFDKERNPSGPYRKEDIALLEAESLKIFDYQTTKNVIVTFAALVIVGYTMTYWTRLRDCTFFTTIWKNPFLVLCVTLVALPLLEQQGPNLIRVAVNRLNAILNSPLYKEEKSRRDKVKKPRAHQ